MTDKELAKEYVDKLYAEKVSKEDYDKDGWILYRCEDISEAFLAGLKAGKDTNVSTKWHKVDDGDLPPLDTNVLVIHRWARTPEVGKRIKVFVNSSVWVWAMCSDRFRYTSDDKDVIAWCEIPQYTEE